MLRRATPVCLAVLLLACDRGGSAGPSGTAIASASASTPESTAADACIATMRTELKATDQEGKGGRMAAGCAATFKDPVCRAAHEKFDMPEHSVRNATLARACADAYCPKLSAPKPRLCTSGTDIGPGQLVLEWDELRYAAWKLDLGDHEAGRLRRELLRLGAQ